jgi:hypothetical protein
MAEYFVPILVAEEGGKEGSVLQSVLGQKMRTRMGSHQDVKIKRKRRNDSSVRIELKFKRVG